MDPSEYHPFINIRDMPSVGKASTFLVHNHWVTLCDIISDESVRRPTFLVRDRKGDEMYVDFMLKDEETEEKFFDLVKVGCSFSLLDMKTTKRRGDLIAVEVKEDNMDNVHVRPSSPRLVQLSAVQSSTIVSLISASCQRTSSS